MKYHQIKFSSINFKSVKANSDFRTDAEYYHPEALKIHETIKSKNGFLFFDKVKKISSGKNLPQKLNGKYKFIRTQNIKSILIDDGGMSFTNDLQGLGLLKEGELLFVRVGEPGNSSIVTKFYEGHSISDNILRLKIEGVNPYFCSAFFNSKSGRIYFNRVLKGTAQGLISQENFKEVLLPNLNENFQNIIQNLIEQADTFLEKSKHFYLNADKLLLSELRLENWQPEHELCFVRKFSKTQKFERLDAEHFQPKYIEIINAIKNYSGGHDILENLLRIKDKNFYPINFKKYKYIELSNISSNGEIMNCTENIGEKLPTRARRKISEGDVIVSSIEGSLDNVAFVSKDWHGALCSNGFFVINSEIINSETLFIFMKSKIGQMQLKKNCRGAILANIRKHDFQNMIIPNIKMETQEAIKEKIAAMYQAKKISKRLIEIATEGVEKAIEKNESVAEQWIHSETEKLGISL